MISRIAYKLRKKDEGASIIEFALILPILIVLVIGIIEFGWILTGYITINGAAREGARTAVLDGNYAEAVYRHTSSMNALSVNAPSLNKGEPGEKTTVTVTGSLPTLIGFFDFLGESYSFIAEATMRQDGFIIAEPDPDADINPTVPDTPTATINGNHVDITGVNNSATVYLYIYNEDNDSYDQIGSPETTNQNQDSVKFNNAARDNQGETLYFRQKIIIDGEDVYSDYGSIYIQD